MFRNDLKAYSELGRALWAEEQRSRSITLETLSAVGSLAITGEKKIERASRALLDRALREGRASTSQKNSAALNQPFYRLSAEERFLLVALHLARWSYAKISRVFGESTDQIERMAWIARMNLGRKGCPAGPKQKGLSCPEYDGHKPWTQRFMDEEIGNARERIFLQNHLMACDDCRQALNRCRDLYYSIEKMMPTASGLDPDDLQRVFEAPPGAAAPDAGFFRSLGVFLGRTDVQLILGASLAAILAKIL